MEIKVNEEILSCPFCGKGGEGIVYVIASGCSYAVYCDNCSAQGISMLQASDAVKYWNELSALKLRSGGERTTNNRYMTALEVLTEYGSVEDVQYQDEHTFEMWLNERLNPPKAADCI